MDPRIKHALAVAAVLAAAPFAPAASADSFVGFTAGRSQWPGDACFAGQSCGRSGTAWAAKAGVGVAPLVAVETRYFDLGRSRSAYGAGVGASVAVPIAPFFAITGLAGASRVRTDAGGSRTSSQPYYGLGVRFTFAPNLDASLEAQRYRAEFASGGKADIDLFGAGLTVRF